MKPSFVHAAAEPGSGALPGCSQTAESQRVMNLAAAVSAATTAAERCVPSPAKRTTAFVPETTSQPEGARGVATGATGAAGPVRVAGAPPEDARLTPA